MARKIIAAFLLAVATSSANAACVPSDIVVADRSRFKPTIDNARTVLSSIGLQSEAAVFGGGDVKAFAAQVAGRKPKAVIMHYSMFRAGDNNRGKVLSTFVEELNKSNPAPSTYVIYSSSLRHPVNHPNGNTKDTFQRRGYFRNVPYDKIELVFVREAGRFVGGNGDVELKRLFRGLEGALCGQ